MSVAGDDTTRLGHGAGGAESRVQRPPAEVRYAEELARLRADDTARRPPGWVLSLQAARRFIVGDEAAASAVISSATRR